MDEQDWLLDSGLPQADQYAQLYDQPLDWPAGNRHQLIDTELQQFMDVLPTGHREQRPSLQSVRHNNQNSLPTPNARQLKHLRSPFQYQETTSNLDSAQDNPNGISWLDACHEPLEVPTPFVSQADEGKISQLQREVRVLQNEIQDLKRRVLGNRHLRCEVNDWERGEISQLQRETREFRDFKNEMELKSTAAEVKLNDIESRTLPEIAQYITSFREWVVTQLTMNNPSTTVATTTSGIGTDVGLWSDEDGDIENKGLVTPKDRQSPYTD